MRAGEAGRTFAVVADEVKGLANDTRKATEEISKTVETLGQEAATVINQIEAGSVASREAKSSVASIERTIKEVGQLVEQVDLQNEVIAQSTGTISDHVHQVQDVLSSFDKAALENESKLKNAHERMEDLELTASAMFDCLVKAGLSPRDEEMVKLALEQANSVIALIEDAVEQKELREADLFDRNYVPVEGTNPQLYRTRFSNWADRKIRPLLDDVEALSSEVIGGVLTDMQGFLPTHSTACSQTPTGDVAHDTANCRNGVKFLGGQDIAAKESRDQFMMAVYRSEAKADGYAVVRNVYVPLVVNGKRWGDYELAYTFD